MARYNVGDKVRIISTRGESWNCSGEMDKWMGKIMTIGEVVSENLYKMEEDKTENSGYGWLWHTDDIVEKIETPKFKVGDRVRAKIGVGYGTQKHRGEIGTIINIACGDFLIEFDNHINGHNGLGYGVKGKAEHCWWLEEENLEAAPSLKFKPGDKVRIKATLEGGTHYGGLYFNNRMKQFRGKVYTIKKVVYENKYQLDDERNDWIYNDAMLEPVDNLKVGDKVIGNDEASEHYGITKKGYIGKVTKVCGNNIELNGLYIVRPECFDLYIETQPKQPNKIVITTDGKTTTAKMYLDEKLIDEKTAKCSPDDKFDFKVGARIAFDRLVGEEEKKEAPKEEAPKGTLKIEIGKKYKLKDYDKVEDHLGIGNTTWNEIQRGALTVKSKTDNGNYRCESDVRGTWIIVSEAFECEWEEPISVNGFKVGDRVNYDGHNATVIAISFRDSIGIEFDEPGYGLHGCEVRKKAGKAGKPDMCLWVCSDSKRLKHGEVPTYYNGKVVCVDNEGNPTIYTPGKIYQFVDGQITDDEGDKLPSISRVRSFKDWQDWSVSKWIEVVE